MFKGFKQFILRGNVIDLAVAVIIGAAFGKIVTGLVNDILNPLIALVAGKPNFSEIQFVVNGTKFPVGDLINDIVSFLMVALALYLFVVAPMNAWNERKHRGEAPADPTTKKCTECLTEIPIAAKRCSACTSPQTV